MRNQKTMRYVRIEEDEGARQRKKYEETLKQKKDLLKQEFDQLEEIRRFDEMSVKSLNEIRFKSELDKLTNIRKQRENTLTNLEKHLSELQKKNQSEQEGLQSGVSQMSSSVAFRSSMINNHHSDVLYQTFSKNLLAKGADDYTDYIQELKTEQERYQQLLESEIERTKSLNSVQEELIKTKILLQQEIHEYKLLNKAAHNRFGNIEALKYLANEKSTQSKKNLKAIKNELKEMDELRNNWQKTQNDKQREYKKEIYVGEEYVSHNGLKIEEHEQKNLQLIKEIEQLEQEEKRILAKRQKKCFESFEAIFMNRIKNVHEGIHVRQVDLYEVNETIMNQKTQQLQHEEGIISTEHKQFDRNQLINMINGFFEKHPSGPNSILKFMIEKFWQQTIELQQNNMTYENLLNEKTKLCQIIDNLDEQLHELLMKNSYIKQEEGQSDETQTTDKLNTESVLDNRQQVAYDAGLFLSSIARSGSQSVQPKTTTLNIFKLELDEVSENDTLAAKNLKIQNLLFNFMLSVSELLHRSAQTLVKVNENSLNLTSTDLEQHVNSILQFVQGIWNKSQNAFKNLPIDNNFVKTQNKKSKVSYENKQTAVLDTYTPESEMNQGDQILNLFQIQSIFIEVIEPLQRTYQLSKEQQNNLNNLIDECSQYFYVRSKQDQLIWNLLSLQNLQRWLIEVKNQYIQPALQQQQIEKLTANDFLPPQVFSDLRQELVQVFCGNFKVLLSQYQILENKLKGLNGDLKSYLKEKDPKFDPKKLSHIVLREGLTIKEARENISRKIDLYRTGEVKRPDSNTQNQSGFAKFSNKRTPSQGKQEGEMNDQEVQNKGTNSTEQQQITVQQEMFKLEEKFNDDQLIQIKDFFKNRLTNKYDPVQEAKKRALEEQKKALAALSNLSEKDEFEEERDEVKDVLLSSWIQAQEQHTRATQLPQEREQYNEKRAQIKEVTQRLYGEPDETALTLKTMALRNGILSDIDRLEKQPSAIEQPQMVQNFKMQKKNMNRNLNKELSLPTLNFLKPTSAYFSRRQLSQEQLRAMAQKKYDLIENGIPSQTNPRPNTDNTASTKNKYSRVNNISKTISKDQSAAIEMFYARYGNQQTSQQFLDYLMSQKSQIPYDQNTQKNELTLQDFQFQFKRNQTDMQIVSQIGSRPKSILVQPKY